MNIETHLSNIKQLTNDRIRADIKKREYASELIDAKRANRKGSHDGLIIMIENKLAEVNQRIFDIDVKIAALHSQISEGAAHIISHAGFYPNKAQIVIKVNGQSYTRHVIKNGDGKYKGWSIFGYPQMVNYKVGA